MSVFVLKRGAAPTTKPITFSLYNEPYARIAGTWEVKAGTTWAEFVENGHDTGNSTWTPRFTVSGGLVKVQWGTTGGLTSSLWKTMGDTSTTVRSTEMIEETTYYTSMV